MPLQSSVNSAIDSRQGEPDGAAPPPSMSPLLLSLGFKLGYDNVRVTDVTSQPLALACLLNLERLSAFLLEYLKPDLLLFFPEAVARGNTSHSYI